MKPDWKITGFEKRDNGWIMTGEAPLKPSLADLFDGKLKEVTGAPVTEPSQEEEEPGKEVLVVFGPWRKDNTRLGEVWRRECVRGVEVFRGVEFPFFIVPILYPSGVGYKICHEGANADNDFNSPRNDTLEKAKKTFDEYASQQGWVLEDCIDRNPPRPEELTEASTGDNKGEFVVTEISRTSSVVIQEPDCVLGPWETAPYGSRTRRLIKVSPSAKKDVWHSYWVEQEKRGGVPNLCFRIKAHHINPFYGRVFGSFEIAERAFDKWALEQGGELKEPRLEEPLDPNAVLVFGPWIRNESNSGIRSDCWLEGTDKGFHTAGQTCKDSVTYYILHEIEEAGTALLRSTQYSTVAEAEKAVDVFIESKGWVRKPQPEELKLEPELVGPSALWRRDGEDSALSFGPWFGETRKVPGFVQPRLTWQRECLIGHEVFGNSAYPFFIVRLGGEYQIHAFPSVKLHPFQYLVYDSLDAAKKAHDEMVPNIAAMYLHNNRLAALMKGYPTWLKSKEESPPKEEEQKFPPIPEKVLGPWSRVVSGWRVKLGYLFERVALNSERKDVGFRIGTSGDEDAYFFVETRIEEAVSFFLPPRTFITIEDAQRAVDDWAMRHGWTLKK